VMGEGAGVIVSLLGLGAFASGPIGGHLADRLGRRPALALATALGGSAMLAMGFVHPLHEGMVKSLGVALDHRGNVHADTNAYATSVPKVFAAGDMRRGQSLVVWAIREGRQAAHAVDEFLMGASALPR